MNDMKPIRFPPPVAADMVRAILTGRKTVTRRVVKQLSDVEMFAEVEFFVSPKTGAIYLGNGIDRLLTIDDKPVVSPYRPGDILYVRETWAAWSRTTGTPPALYYKADGDAPNGIKWRPSIHMPREAARIFLRVTDVSVCRVQDITDEDARKEGCADREDFHRVWNDCYAKPRPVKGEDGTIDHYESYPWEDIQETRTYKGKPWYVIGNPWIWVIEFERIGKEEAVQHV